MKTKALISCTVTAQLICAFVFAYGKSRFSYDAAHIRLASFLWDKVNRIAQDVMPQNMAYHDLPSRAILFACMNFIKNEIIPDTPKMKVDSPI